MTLTMTLEDRLGAASLSVTKAARAYTWTPTEKNLKVLVKACRKYKKLYKKVMLPLHPDLPTDVASFHRETVEVWSDLKKRDGSNLPSVPVNQFAK
jgi:hypothetical protein